MFGLSLFLLFSLLLLLYELLKSLLLFLLLLAEFSLDSPHLDALDDIKLGRVRVLALLFIKLFLFLVVLDPIDATLLLVIVFLRVRHGTPIFLNQFHDLL